MPASICRFPRRIHWRKGEGAARWPDLAEEARAAAMEQGEKWRRREGRRYTIHIWIRKLRFGYYIDFLSPKMT
jgi:hypothetical protein